MGGWMGGWVGGWMDVKAVLRIAYSNQKSLLACLVTQIEKQYAIVLLEIFWSMVNSQ